MRVSTTYIYNAASSAIAERQAQVAKVGDQISSGLRIQSAADDPVGAARVIELENAKALNDRMNTNQTLAMNALSQSESVLGQMNDAYTDIRSLLIQAGNAALSDTDRGSLAQELEANRAALLGMANSRDADGHYFFAGFKESQPPFVSTPSGVAYQGDESSRSIQVGPARTMALTMNGSTLFNGVRSGNGVFEASAAPSNAGSGAINVGDVVDATSLDGNAYTLQFHKSGSSITYDVVNAGSGAVVSAANTYTPGAEIVVAGMRVKVSGQPAEGDAFSLAPPRTRNAFAAIDDAIRLLRTPVKDDAARIRLAAGIAAGIAQIDQASERVQLARATAGASLKELDTLGAASSNADIEIQKQLSQYRDIDYAKAATELTQGQMTLNATQQAYAKILGKSIFDFI